MGVTTQKYDILTRVAVGNGALVYRAVDKSSSRQVALKLLVQEGDLDHRFNVEALLADSGKLTAITGAHVCQLLDAHTDEDGPVLIYEFANGISGAELPSTRKLEGAHALDVAAQLVSALRSGERQRCPHGDVKPSNIVFVDLPDGRLFTLVLDWGLTAYRTAVADDSLPFQAPERLAGAAASHPADLFSLGALLFYLYTGKLLVAGAKREELLAGWQKARPAILGELRPDLPPKLVQWVCSLLELTPEKRPASAVDAATALVALNPPAPPIPPETIRPRSTLPRPPGSLGSGIAKAPPASSAPRPSPASAASPSASQPAKPSPQPAKLSHVAMTLGLFLLFLALVSASVWFVFFRKKEPEFLTKTVAEQPGQPVAARTPSPSVGTSIDKKFTSPPPMPAAAKAKPSSIPVATIALASTKPSPNAGKTTSPLIASESFEYEDGKALEGAGNGSGWAGPWKGTLAKVQGASLDAQPFPARGRSLVMPPTEEEIKISRAIGPLNKFTGDPKKGGTWYFACLLQHGSGLPAAGGDVQINPLTDSNVHDLVRIVASDVGGALQVTLNDAKPIEIADLSKPILVVLEMKLGKQAKNGKSTLDAVLFVNPAISPKWMPANDRRIAVKLENVSLPNQLGLLIRKPPRSEATTRIDEIRFARKSADLAYRPPANAKPPAPAFKN